MPDPSEFERATAVRPLGDHRYEADVPDGWQQGRGAFGGLVLATMQRAMGHFVANPARRPRALTAEICGPLQPGRAEVKVELLRQGSNTSFVNAVLIQEGKVMARASTVFATARKAATTPRAEPPAPPRPFEQVEVLPVAPPFGPAFAAHYEYRSTGPMPFSGGTEARCEGFIREREPVTVLDPSAVLGRLDAWWPTLYSVETELRAAATISFTAELLTDATTLDPKVPFFHRSRMVVLQDGFFVEFRELWSGQTPVAMNQQTFAVLS
ncbi:MAG: thioesterase family protein [Myxococcaceae bacterium]|nr:thioesterase family protein [Myxococcaceae bacterium]